MSLAFAMVIDAQIQGFCLRSNNNLADNWGDRNEQRAVSLMDEQMKKSVLFNARSIKRFQDYETYIRL